MKQTTGGAGVLCRAPNQLLKTQGGSMENEWRRQMPADTQWYCWAPEEKLGDFQLHKGWGDCFLSSASALRKQNRSQKKNVGLWKKYTKKTQYNSTQPQALSPTVKQQADHVNVRMENAWCDSQPFRYLQNQRAVTLAKWLPASSSQGWSQRWTGRGYNFSMNSAGSFPCTSKDVTHTPRGHPLA